MLSKYKLAFGNIQSHIRSEKVKAMSEKFRDTVTHLSYPFAWFNKYDKYVRGESLELTIHLLASMNNFLFNELPIRQALGKFSKCLFMAEIFQPADHTHKYA